MAIMFITRYLFESRFIILIVWLISFIFVSIERIIIRTIQRSLYKHGIGVHRAILIGNTQAAHDLIRDFKKMPTLGYRVVAHFPEFNDAVKAELRDLAWRDKFDEVIQTDPEMPRQKVLEIIDLLNDYHLDFKYTADLLGAKMSNFEIKTYDGIPIIELKRTPLDGWGRIFKRAFDIILSIILIITFLPIMFIIALAIKLDSKGPVLFKYRRVGQTGKPFTFLKFRSMIKDAHKYRFDPEFIAKHKDLRAGTPMMKFKNDPRITRVGKFIRRWSLDEFPQFFLVLIGKMSLVGPRPHEIEEVANYNKYQRKVLAIKPGITGLAQVSGRSDLDFDEEVKLDTYYIENWSIKLDLQILLRTPMAILKRREAE
jgi:exopolysaccharide biosynthesis polyprenyl glycosylphosphotransferase